MMPINFFIAFTFPAPNSPNLLLHLLVPSQRFSLFPLACPWAYFPRFFSFKAGAVMVADFFRVLFVPGLQCVKKKDPPPPQQGAFLSPLLFKSKLTFFSLNYSIAPRLRRLTILPSGSSFSLVTDEATHRHLVAKFPFHFFFSHLRLFFSQRSTPGLRLLLNTSQPVSRFHKVTHRP